MYHCAQTAVRTYENIIADGYIGFVKDGKIEIAYEVLTDVYDIVFVNGRIGWL